MSPEQARGKSVDKRTDIWAYGCCLYEDLTGKLPFQGDTIADTVGSILKTDPEWLKLPTDTPRELRSLLRRCLEKDTRKRFSSAGDMAYMLELHLEQSRRLDDEATVAPTTSKAPSRPTSKDPIFVGVALAMVGVFAGIWLGRGQDSETPPGANVTPRITSLAVIPFVKLNDEPDHFVDGMADAIRGELAKISSLDKVISNTSMRRYRETDLSIPEIAEAVKVQGLIEGSVLREDGNVTISVTLFYAPDERQLWTISYKRPEESVGQIYTEVAFAIAEEISVKIEPDTQRRTADKDDVNPKALDAYLRGRQLITSRTRDDMTLALLEFERAIEIDKEYAVAYSGLADAYSLLGGYHYVLPGDAFTKAEQAALKAISLDATLPEAYASLGQILLHHKGDWRGAEEAFKESLSLDSNFAQGNSWYGMYLDDVGRIEEARRTTERALELDPHSLITKKMLAGLTAS